ncbi:TonB-dependent receptor [Sphingobium aquiterrae]|uniref:TonB-dependent receptor n=1 Tax=Sphingobium aquiterrae TaxID=2038656 RepID=UPI0030191BD0
MPRRGDIILKACVGPLLLIALPAGLAQAAGAAQPTERQAVDVPAGRLGDAIVLLARQTGSNIGTTDPAVAALPIRAIRGRMSAGDALDRLLSGSGARAERIDARTWRIVARRAPVQRPSPAPAPRAMPAPAILDEADDSEVIVTAAKRPMPLARYAGTIEMLSDAFPAADAASGTAALLGRVSAISSTHVGAGRNKLFIRAIADSGFSGPTQATTGQYLNDMRLNYATPDPDLRLYDIAGVEVLEGPQGTLYGAGSLGGIIRLVPNAPNATRASAEVSAGVSATQHGEPGGDLAATINLPLVADVLAVRAVGYGVREGGYIDDSLRALDDINRTNIAGGRLSLRYTPGTDWTIDLTGLYQSIRYDDAQYASRSAGELTRASPFAENGGSDYWLGNVRAERRWDDLTLVTSAGIVGQKLSERYDASEPGGPPELLHQRNDTRMFSTETRLSRDLHDGIGWLVGFSYLDSRSDINRTLGPPGAPAPSAGVRNEQREWTAFGETSIELRPGLVATAGGRLTRSTLSGTSKGPLPLMLAVTDVARAVAASNRHETIFLPSFALLSDALPNTTMFLRFQQGFRPGGLSIDDYRAQSYRNDRTTTVEAGIRHGLPGIDPVAVSGSIAWTDWQDIQADLIDRRGLPTTVNIGDGRIYTAEARLTLHPIAGFTVDGSIIYNDSRLSRPESFVRLLSFAGEKLTLPNVAALGGRLAADYRLVLGDGSLLRLSANARYVGSSRLGVGPRVGTRQGDYVDTGITAALSRGQWRLSLGMTNIADAAGNRFALGTPFDLSGDDYTPMRPRTVRLGMDFAF